MQKYLREKEANMYAHVQEEKQKLLAEKREKVLIQDNSQFLYDNVTGAPVHLSVAAGEMEKEMVNVRAGRFIKDKMMPVVDASISPKSDKKYVPPDKRPVVNRREWRARKEGLPLEEITDEECDSETIESVLGQEILDSLLGSTDDDSKRPGAPVPPLVKPLTGIINMSGRRLMETKMSFIGGSFFQPKKTIKISVQNEDSPSKPEIATCTASTVTTPRNGKVKSGSVTAKSPKRKLNFRKVNGNNNKTILVDTNNILQETYYHDSHDVSIDRQEVEQGQTHHKDHS